MSSHTLDRIIATNSKSTSTTSRKKADCKSETNWYTIGIAVVALLIVAAFCYYYFFCGAKVEAVTEEECIIDEMKQLASKNHGVPRTYAEGTTSLEDFRAYSRTHETCGL